MRVCRRSFFRSGRGRWESRRGGRGAFCRQSHWGLRVEQNSFTAFATATCFRCRWTSAASVSSHPKRTQEGSFRLYGPLWKLGRRRHRWHGGVLLLLASGVSPSPCPPFLEICIPDGAAVVYRELTQKVLSLPWILRWNVPALFVTRRIADARQVAVLRVLLAPPSCGHRWGPSPTKVLRPNIHEEDTRYSEVTDVVDGFGGSWH